MAALNTRCREILHLLLNSSKPLTMREISTQTECTERQVQYALHQIRFWLQENKVELIARPRIGTYIACTEDKKLELIERITALQGYALVISPAERIRIILLHLLANDQPVQLKQFITETGLSRTTLLKDMEQVALWLQSHHLSLVRRPHFGFKALGDEGDLRGAIISFLFEIPDTVALLNYCSGNKTALRILLKGSNELLTRLVTFLDALDLAGSEKMVKQLEQDSPRKFTDDAYLLLVLHIAIMVWRHKNKHDIQVPQKSLDYLKGKREIPLVQNLAVSCFQLPPGSLPEFEIAWVAMNLLSAQILPSAADIMSDEWLAGVDPDIVRIISTFLEETSLYLHPLLKSDRQLIQNLIFHFESAVYRFRFNLPVINPQISESKKQCPYIFQVIHKCKNILSNSIGAEIPEEEIDFLALHFVAAMERLRAPQSNRKKVIVVCGEGVATSWLVVSKLQVEVPEVEVVEITSILNLSRRRSIGGEIDGIISTVPLQIAGFPIIHINPLVTPLDIKNIRFLLRIDEHAASGSLDELSRIDGPSLSSLIDADKIRINIPAENWEGVIDGAADRLLEAGLVKPQFIDAMKEVIHKNGPYVVVAPGIALLHAHPARGVLNLCASLVTVKPPVNFGHPVNDPVSIALILGAVDHQSHIRALLEFIELIRDPAAIRKILAASDPTEIVDVLRLFASKGSVMTLLESANQPGM